MQFADVKQKAKQYAMEKKDTVIIYKADSYTFCTATYFFAHYPGEFVEAVSQLPPVTT